MSIFQLETTRAFHPNIAVVLNVTPNHMDRYESFTDYAAAKHRIFMNQGPGDVAILNADDEIVASWAKGLRAHVASFSVKQQLEEGLFLRGREIVSRTKAGQRVLLNADDMKLRGLHNVENVLAALAAGLACGAAPESMRQTVAAFEPVEHRLEFVAEVAGVKFYNDSKATSVDATLKALEAFAGDVGSDSEEDGGEGGIEGKVVLILGGRGKKAPYAPLASLIKARVRKLILIGEDAETIVNELGEFAASERATDMKDAVARSFQAAQAGAVVLLAPACASFDMFDSFEHRGRVFKDAVQSLKSKVQSPPS
jgi:UDP-N-acetylmuramoylalanine--D-glutamate ligase